MIIKLEGKNTIEKVILELRKMIEGSKWQNQVYLVGGSVRDLIMGKDIHDIDLVVAWPNGGIDFAEWVCKEMDCYKEGSNPVIFPSYGTAKFNIRSIHEFSGVDIECVHPRRETYSKTSRKPSTVYGTLLQDAERRDLTINALYMNISTFSILDPTVCGLKDIKNQIIRCPNDPNKTFDDDPLRILRVIRFATRFGWNIEKDTWLGMVANAHRLAIVSQERITEELTKILLCDKPSVGLNRLLYSGVMRYVMPEVREMNNCEQGKQHFGNVFEHTLAVVDKTKPISVNRWGALFHDIAKPTVKQPSFDGTIRFPSHEYVGTTLADDILKRMKFSNHDKEMIKLCIKEHMRFKQCGNKAPSKKAVRKLLDDIGDEERVEMLLDVIEADNMSHAKPYQMPNQIDGVRKAIEAIKKDSGGEAKLVIPINGKDIMDKYDLHSGPTIGMLMKLAHNLVVENPSITKEEIYVAIEKKLAV